MHVHTLNCQSLNLSKGHLTIPERSQRIARYIYVDLPNVWAFSPQARYQKDSRSNDIYHHQSVSHMSIKHVYRSHVFGCKKLGTPFFPANKTTSYVLECKQFWSSHPVKKCGDVGSEGVRMTNQFSRIFLVVSSRLLEEFQTYEMNILNIVA